jgi:hypothetical protein
MARTTSRTPFRGALGALLTGALVAGLVTVGGAPAFAEELDPGNRIADTLTLSPTSGTLEAGPTAVTSTATCPEGYRASGRTVLLNGEGNTFFAGAQRKIATKAGHGLDGNPLNLTGSFASYFSGVGFTNWTDGEVTLVYTCDDSVLPANNYVIGASRYFSVTLHVDKAANTWSVEAPAEKTATTTSLAASGVTATAATLTATVDPAAATGTVTFTKDGAAIGSPATVTGGTATIQVSDLSPATTYTFGATYSGDTTYATSAGSTTATTIAAAATATPSVAVQPAVTATDPTGLTLSVASSAVTLTGPTARTQGEVWTATGALGEVTVKDDRRNASAGGWTLNGKVGAFTAGAGSIAAANLGWAPEKVSGAGTAGAAVTAGADGGLSADRPLATGSASAAQDVLTVVKAGLTLKVPADAADGAYTSTLTLTLI